jgi:hypothetical protein
MIDPVKSLLIDAEEYWTNMNVGDEITTRDIYRGISSDKNFDVHKLNSLGAFLTNKVKYGLSEKIGESVSDPTFKKISNKSSRPKNKRFCDVLNSEFKLEEKIVPAELSLRYKNINPRDTITKNYISKLLFSLERHKCLIKLERGVYMKVRDIAEHEMTTVTRFIKAKKPQEVERKVPVNLPQIDGYATVKSITLEEYIKEIKTLKLIIKAQQKEIEVKDQFILGLPRFDLPSLDTEEYADLKKKYGIQ